MIEGAVTAGASPPPYSREVSAPKVVAGSYLLGVGRPLAAAEWLP